MVEDAMTKYKIELSVPPEAVAKVSATELGVWQRQLFGKLNGASGLIHTENLGSRKQVGQQPSYSTSSTSGSDCA